LVRYWNDKWGFVKVCRYSELEDGRVLRVKWWVETQDGLFVDFRPGNKKEDRQILKNRGSAVWYCLKYVSKQATELQKLLMSATRKRSFSLSRDVRLQKAKQDKEYAETKDSWVLHAYFYDKDGNFPEDSVLPWKEASLDPIIGPIISPKLVETFKYCISCGIQRRLMLPHGSRQLNSRSFKCKHCKTSGSSPEPSKTVLNNTLKRINQRLQAFYSRKLQNQFMPCHELQLMKCSRLRPCRRQYLELHKCDPD